MTAERRPASPPDRPSESAEGSAASRIVLHLFVTGSGTRSEHAIRTLTSLCGRLRDRCELVVVDVLERPQLAEDQRILATPTVVRQHPLPARRVIGDLSDLGQVIAGLDLPRELMEQGAPA